MNMRVSYEAILDSCAMQNVCVTERDIEQMLLNKIPMAANVKKVIKSLLIGEPIKAEKESIRQKLANVDTELDQLCEVIKTGKMTKSQLSELTGFTEDHTRYLLHRLTVKNRAQCDEGFKWSLVEGERTVRPNIFARSQAKKDGLSTYDGVPHKCGTTTKYTKSGNCVNCHLKINKERYLRDAML